MAPQGSLGTMSVPEVLSWLDQSARSGLLIIDGPRARTTLLGQFLLFHGAMSEDTLREARLDRAEAG
jgi:hypothetical protein